MLGAIDLGIANDSKRACREQTTQITVTWLADADRACPCLHSNAASAPVQSRPRSLALTETLSDRQCWQPAHGQHMTNARDRIEPLARRVGSMPGRDHAVELQELCFQGSQLGAVGDDIEQLFHTMASDRCNKAKLGKMGTDRVDHCGVLANKQVPRAMKH